jgi:hypothetical protein
MLTGALVTSFQSENASFLHTIRQLWDALNQNGNPGSAQKCLSDIESELTQNTETLEQEVLRFLLRLARGGQFEIDDLSDATLLYCRALHISCGFDFIRLRLVIVGLDWLLALLTQLEQNCVIDWQVLLRAEEDDLRFLTCFFSFSSHFDRMFARDIDL